MTDPKKIVVIGGGIGGVATALELADAGFRVELIERRDGLIEGSSNNSLQRVCPGYHYPDFDTAKHLLDECIRVLKHYGKYVVGAGADPTAQGKGCDYFLVEDSNIDVDVTIGLYKKLQAYYARLVEENLNNKVFGEPKDFYRVLKINEYKQLVNTDKVTLGVRTAEKVLDIGRLKKDLIAKVREHLNITITTNAKVVGVKNELDGSAEITYEKTDGQKNTVTAGAVINAAWEGSDEINRKSGILLPAKDRGVVVLKEEDNAQVAHRVSGDQWAVATESPYLKRTKVIIHVVLPKEFLDQNPNSMFFCYGPYCSMNRIGPNDKGEEMAIIASELVTNVDATTKVELSELSNKLIYGQPTDEELRAYGERILTTATDYIPSLEGATIHSVGRGVVLTRNGKSIDERDESGVQEDALFKIRNLCMKLTFFDGNAEEVVKRLKEHFETAQAIETVLSAVEGHVDVKMSLRKMFQGLFFQPSPWSLVGKNDFERNHWVEQEPNARKKSDAEIPSWGSTTEVVQQLGATMNKKTAVVAEVLARVPLVDDETRSRVYSEPLVPLSEPDASEKGDHTFEGSTGSPASSSLPSFSLRS